MAVLNDTQALAWVATGSGRLSHAAAGVLLDPDQDLLVGAVTAYEFADLNRRGRFDADLPLDPILRQLHATLLDYPVDAYRIVPLLPLLHRDPVDRMLIAHAIRADMAFMTADAAARDYPVRSIW